MKRFLASALILSLFSVCTLAGCSEDTTVKESKVIDTPDGSIKKTTETTVEKTGDMKEGATPGEAPK